VKLKYYLRGLGLGIIITTLILTVSVRVRGGIMTDDKVIERAAELGMVIPEESGENSQDTESNDTSANEMPANDTPESGSGAQPELSTGNSQ
jgi:hypothetical protein